ncbi:MAG: hypothetical protein CM1200mP26_11150 [Acidimicrobiales bacterium]|nr:MAG: hypothetical protein CM1200mP26_11150 [Acidimicrobiales bacterium]
MGYSILVLEPGSSHPLSSTALGPELTGRHRLDITRGAHGEHHLLVIDEVLDIEFSWIVHHLASPWSGMPVTDLTEFILDDALKEFLVTEDLL